MSSEEAARIAELERENRELRKVNEILRTASAFFAAAELAWPFHWAESATSTHHEPFMIHCLAASICPAGKCLISADTKCDVKCSATSPRWESVTTPIFLMRL